MYFSELWGTLSGRMAWADLVFSGRSWRVVAGHPHEDSAFPWSLLCSTVADLALQSRLVCFAGLVGYKSCSCC